MLNIGNTYNELSDLQNAVAYHLKAMKLFEEVKNKRGQSFCFQNLGNDFLSLKQFNVAEKYFTQAAALKEELGDARGVITSWTSLGEVYRQLRKPTIAMKYFKKSLKRADELKLRASERNILFNMGLVLKDQKQNDEARARFLECISLSRQAGDSLLVSKAKVGLLMMENSEQAENKEEQTLAENVQLSREQGDRSNAAESYQKMADWYAAHKQFEKAFKYQKQSQQLDDSVRGHEIVVQLKRMEEEYKSEKKEKEIALLKKDQELQQVTLGRQKAIITSIVIALVGILLIAFLAVNRYRAINNAKRLIEIERVRNNIARDLHDDVGSTLSSINILSQVALVEKNGNTESYLQRIGDQSARMMEDIGDIVWSINPQNDSMQQVITRMKEFSAEILESKNIAYNFSEQISDGITLDADQRKNLFLIFKETINNAAKYSSARLIDINIHQQDQTLTMRVKDNGLGFNEHEVSIGNGLRNLRERAKEIKGSIELKSFLGNGTEVELKFPLA
jgi:signal transduction histidine kinase